MEIKKPLINLLLIVLVVGCVWFFHTIPSIVLFYATFSALLVCLYRDGSRIFVFLAFMSSFLAVVPGILQLLLAKFIGERYSSLASVIIMVAVLGIVGGETLGSCRKKGARHLLILVLMTLGTAYVFREPLLYEKTLLLVYLLVVSTLAVLFGGTNSLQININRAHTVIGLVLFLVIFAASNYLLKENLGKVALIDCFGVWAKSNIGYSKENFRLESGYSYSLLKEVLQRKYSLYVVKDRSKLTETLSQVKAAIIITPTTPLTHSEIEEISQFVVNGGRLVIVGDHTDLYGHARVLNNLTRKFGVTLNYDALFNPGDYYSEVRLMNMQMHSIRPKTACSIKPNTYGFVFAWADDWVSEAADYFRPNFFGELSWTSDDILGSFPVGVLAKHGKGIVVIWGDSTIFSNFCIFQPGHLKFLGTLLEGGELLMFLQAPCLLFLGIFSLLLLFPCAAKRPFIVYCAIGLVIFSGSFYAWDFREESFYPIDKRLDVYGPKQLLMEPPPRRLPDEFQFSSAYSHIARSGIWPLYRGKKPKTPVSNRSIWIAALTEVKQMDLRVLSSLWGVVLNKVDGKMEDFAEKKMPDDLAPVFRDWFPGVSPRKVWLKNGDSHSGIVKGTSFLVADGILTDRHLGDWWIVNELSPYRIHVLSGWFDWLTDRKDVKQFRYPEIGIKEKGGSWIVSVEGLHDKLIKMSVEQYGSNRSYVYLGSGIWSLYEKTPDGEFLLGGVELSDDISRSRYFKWAAKSVNK